VASAEAPYFSRDFAEIADSRRALTADVFVEDSFVHRHFRRGWPAGISSRVSRSRAAWHGGRGAGISIVTF
jgi:hypothetical protein